MSSSDQYRPLADVRLLVVAREVGLHDGVSREIEKWKTALEVAGACVDTAAVFGGPTHDLNLLMEPSATAYKHWVRIAGPYDIVLVENLLTLPLGLPGVHQLAESLSDKRTLIHHHDIPWDRGVEPPCDLRHSDWRHVVNSRRALRAFATHGIDSIVIPNLFVSRKPTLDRKSVRRAIGVHYSELLALHPTRAIARKDVPTAIRIAEQLGATYWLPGPAEDDYGRTLDTIIAQAGVRVIRGLPHTIDMREAYEAADVVLYPSILEGFGNPIIESALYRRPLIGAEFPIAAEFRELGLVWFGKKEIEDLRLHLRTPDEKLLTRNQTLAFNHFTGEAVVQQMLDVIWGLLGNSRVRCGASK